MRTLTARRDPARRGTPPLRACPVCGAERRRWGLPTLCRDCYRETCAGGGGTPLPTRAPAAPTDAAPGSEARIAVYAARAAAGERLYHPGDRRMDRE